jgi:hypothetical protein
MLSAHGSGSLNVGRPAFVPSAGACPHSLVKHAAPTSAQKHRTLSPEARERHKKAGRQQYLERTALGLCHQCDKPARAGRTHCEDCAQRSAHERRERHARRKESGLCVQCQAPALPGMTRCQVCNDAHNQYLRDRIAAGLCGCGQPLVPGLKQCAACLEKDAARRDERRARGVCSQCGKNPAPPGERCQACRDNEQRWYVGRKQEGSCIDCGKPARPGRVHCEEHATHVSERRVRRIAEAKEQGICAKCRKEPYVSAENGLCTVCYLKDAAGRHLGSWRRWRDLQDLFERQGGRCALSGVVLTLGRDTWVDHIVPRSRGGALNDITNLQWTHGVVNRIKDNVGEDDLRTIIAAIYQTMVAAAQADGGGRP